MSVLLEFSMFPTDKGESISAYVARVLALIDEGGIPYCLTPMGTIIETETFEQALNVLHQAYNQLALDCDRVYVSAKLDIRKGKGGRLTQKIESVEKRVGRKLKTS
jgi:uncharacterized protein (TIGR00106 family)